MIQPTKSLSQNPVGIALVHSSVVVACGMGWSICGLFHNLPYSQTVWDTCAQIRGFAA